jgi:hypothetical protein
MLSSFSQICGGLLTLTSLLVAPGLAAPATTVDLPKRAAGDKYVFAHFMASLKILHRASAVSLDGHEANVVF